VDTAARALVEGLSLSRDPIGGQPPDRTDRRCLRNGVWPRADRRKDVSVPRFGS